MGVRTRGVKKQNINKEAAEIENEEYEEYAENNITEDTSERSTL